MMFRILIPCDYSEAFRQALEACALFDWQMPVEVIIGTIVDPMQVATRGPAEQLDFEDWLGTFSTKLKITRLQGWGRFVPAVLEMVVAESIDLIIVGTRGARGWDGVFMGSHAEKIVRVSPVPVITIPHRAHATRASDIVVPVDVHQDAVGLSHCLKKLSAWYPARFHLVYVKTGQSVSERRAMELLAECGRQLGLTHSSPEVVYAASVADGILSHAAQMGADMIAMGTMGNPGPAQMYRPSIAADVVNHARIPVFICPVAQETIIH